MYIYQISRVEFRLQDISKLSSMDHFHKDTDGDEGRDKAEEGLGVCFIVGPVGGGIG